MAILEQYPKLTGILYDSPAVVAQARSHGETDSALKQRTEFCSGNFFEAIPAGADAYIFKHILHDWTDDECQQILNNCREAIERNGKLLIFEQIVPNFKVAHPSKMLDLEMMVCTGGRERTAQEFEQLLTATGFRLSKVIATESPLSVIEAVPT